MVDEKIARSAAKLAAIFLTDPDTPALFVVRAEVCDPYTHFLGYPRIVAGGGVVVRDGRFLMIRRRGAWDLPKGHIEKEETIEEGACREVSEETGLSNVRVTAPLGLTRHMLRLPTGKWAFKETSWYALTSEGEPHPQAEEDITECRWVTPGEATELAAGSYVTIQKVIKSLIDSLTPSLPPPETK